MAGFKLHNPSCTCIWCRMGDRIYHFFPAFYRIYDRVMRGVRYYITERSK